MTDLLAQKEDGIETPVLKHSRSGEGGDEYVRGSRRRGEGAGE